MSTPFRGLPLAFVFLVVATAAWAHAFLLRTSPPVGSQVPAAPAEMTLRFTEPVEILFCAIELQNAAGAAVSLPAPKLSADDPATLIVALPKLASGTYTVVWHVTSIDTHKTEGRYQFSIGS